ncbi:transcription initiation factor IIF subunit alpha isoform X1 [Aegilops tauschii subsp. strangulata]|uniref:transcription initiation factor IIF subunit alpha isoform X1 n=1 Tax=Triticum aestivum TaxID=4565 RepID=UPI001D01E0B3|nr:transcription initiation factor IIF subunit alpha-like isoform X1 [Triticum aestivum]
MGGAADLVLKAACDACGKASELYSTACRHATLCNSCAATMARSRARCNVCAAPITNVIRVPATALGFRFRDQRHCRRRRRAWRFSALLSLTVLFVPTATQEYNVRVDTTAGKALSIAKFNTGVPPFSKMKGAGNKWSLRKDGPTQGRQLTADMREKYYNRKPWILEDDTGEHQYQSKLEASQSATATYYLLIRRGKEFDAVPVGSWYNFSKIAQYKQLTLEEAEEKMNKRRSSATGYERWMMKTATHGAAAFGSDLKDLADAKGKAANGIQSKKESNEDGNHSDKGEEDEEEGVAKKAVRGFSTRGVDDEEDGGKEDFDLEDEIEIGDDWEHEETFTDDDEALDIDPEERPDVADAENPTGPDIKQDDDENEQGAGGSLSKSGKELKKLLRRADGQNESDDEDDGDTDEDESPLSVLAPKLEHQFGSEQQENNTAKLTATELAVSTPPAPRSNQKRKSGGDGAKTSNRAAVKKPKTEPEARTLGVKEEPPSSVEPISKASASAGSDTDMSAITEEEIIRVLRAIAPVRSQDFVPRFKARIRTPEDKKHFHDIVMKYAYSHKTNGVSYLHLRKETTSAITEEEIIGVLSATAPVRSQDFVPRFKDRIRTQEDKKHFHDIVMKFAYSHKTNGVSYLHLRKEYE